MLESADIRFISENTLLVEFGELLDDAMHQNVLKLDTALRRAKINGLIETLPTFRSLSIEFDPFTLSHDALVDSLMNLDFEKLALKNKSWRVPVCFQEPYSEDLQVVAEQLQMSQQTLIEILLTSKFKVYMYGFVPGFTYLGGLDPGLDIPRRQTPRLPVPPGAMIIAGGLAGLMPISMPTGWYVVGQTPITLFSDKRSPMVPFAVGDQLKLTAVDKPEYQRLSVANQQDQYSIAGLEPDE